LSLQDKYHAITSNVKNALAGLKNRYSMLYNSDKYRVSVLRAQPWESRLFEKIEMAKLSYLPEFSLQLYSKQCCLSAEPAAAP